MVTESRSDEDESTLRTTTGMSFWRPLRLPIFESPLFANLISDAGTFMRNVAAFWLMVWFNVGPAYLALTHTASALPFFVLAPLAGSNRDVVDRRKSVLITEAWIMPCAVVIFFLTLCGTMSRWLLLGLAFVLSAAALESSPWRTIELVKSATSPKRVSSMELNSTLRVLSGLCAALKKAPPNAVTYRSTSGLSRS